MDILSFLPIIIMIFAVVSKLNKGTTRSNHRPRSPYAPSSPWVNNLETSIRKKWLSYKTPILSSNVVEGRNDFPMEEFPWIDNTTETEGTAGIEGTDGVEGTNGVEGIAGLEGTLIPTLPSEIKTPQLDEPPSYPDLEGKNLAEAVIWAEILGKPKARINRPLMRNY
ncbi:MAG: hypothetical protein Q8911_11035 [Bacillota bacterium]|nr:hypothetical protein [Bacillota bacterium]